MTHTRLTELPPELLEFDPLRDKSYRRSALGRAVVDFLAWIELEGAAARTLDQYERDLARGCLLFPKLALEDWTADELAHLARTWPKASRRVRVAAWRSFFDWAVRMDKLATNPADKLPRIKREERTKRIEIFNDSEIHRLCALPTIDGALMRILLDAGIRKEEARRLKLEDLRSDPAPGVLWVVGKGSKGREIPATLALAQAVHDLTILEGLNPTDHLWYGTRANPHGRIVRRSTPVGHGTFHRWWERCLAEADIHYRHPHTTRHTFATRYLRHPAGRMDRLSKALGHTSIRTTVDLYGHLDTADLALDFAAIFSGD